MNYFLLHWPAHCFPSTLLLFDVGKHFLASSICASKIYHLFIGIYDCLPGLFFSISCSELFIKSGKERWSTSCIRGNPLYMHHLHGMCLLTDAAEYRCPNCNHSSLLIQNMFCRLTCIHGRKCVLVLSIASCGRCAWKENKHISRKQVLK